MEKYRSWCNLKMIGIFSRGKPDANSPSIRLSIGGWYQPTWVNHDVGKSKIGMRNRRNFSDLILCDGVRVNISHRIVDLSYFDVGKSKIGFLETGGGGDLTIRCEIRYNYHSINDTWKNTDVDEFLKDRNNYKMWRCF